MLSSLDVGQAFLDRARRDHHPISGIALHKILFFAQGHSHSLRQVKLIADDAQALEFGPIYPDVWMAHRIHGARPIETLCRLADSPAEDAELSTFLDVVWSAYREIAPLDLSAMAMVSQGPWARTRAAYPGERAPWISDVLVRDYFTGLKGKMLAELEKEQALAV